MSTLMHSVSFTETIMVAHFISNHSVLAKLFEREIIGTSFKNESYSVVSQ